MGFYTFYRLDSRETTEKHWVERGEWDLQRTSRQESNLGHHERSCALCRHTNHEATGANDRSLFLTMSQLLQSNLKGA